jgi:TRAP-type C4-dicarboxylate transport system substrate-binding protein
MAVRSPATGRLLWAAALLVLLPLLPACTSVPDSGTRSGGEPPSLVLTIGTDDPRGRPASEQMEEFARQVAKRSHGGLRIDLRYRAGGTNNRSWDQVIDRMVVNGELDLGMVPARSWDTEGVDSLRALNTPLLLTSTRAMNTVVTDEDLARDLLGGLEDVGVTGLALVPEGIRYLLPLHDPDRVIDRLAVAGTVRSPRSATVWRFFTALGARPTDAETDIPMVAAESELLLAHTLGGVSGLLGNLPLFPKLNALVVNSERFAGLTDDQRSILREAATATRDWAVARNRDDAELARSFCRLGGRILHVDSVDAARVRGAADAVERELREDPGTAALIDRLRRVAQSVGRAAPLPVCTPRTPAVNARTIRPEGGELPDGTYRFQLSDSWLRSVGLGPEDVELNHGTWTLHVTDGRWQLDQVGPDLHYTESNVYQVRGDELWWRFDDDDAVFHVRWAADAQGTLRFEVPGRGPVHFMFRVPWQRIGDAAVGSLPVTADTIVADGGDLPDGVYRVRFTDAYLAAHGLSQELVDFNHGVWTIELRDGHYTVDQVAPDVTDHDEGIYQVRGRDSWWLLEDGVLLRARWSVGDDGSLRFREVPRPDPPDFQFDIPWRKVS